MNSLTVYRISLGLSVVMTLAAFVLLFPWMGVMVNGAGKLPLAALVPWSSLVLLALTAANCTLRSRLIKHRKSV